MIKKVNFFLNPNAAKDFVSSLKETGFAVITGGVLPQSLIAEVLKDWTHFFNGLSPEKKQKYLFDRESQSGFFPMKTEKAKDSKFQDLKEFYHIYKNADLPAELSPATLTLRDHLLQVAEVLLKWIEQETPVEIRNKFSICLPDMIQGSSHNLLRVLHYPALNGGESQAEIRAAAHEDINLITLLPAVSSPGLQVKLKTGEWVDVPSDLNSIVVNVGDMLEEASGGYFKSTTHQVVNPESGKNVARYSIPLFVHPRGEVVLSERYTANSFLEERLKQLGLK